VFFRLLTIASAPNPNRMPATIDSHGNPGIGGAVSGVTMLLDDVAADVTGVVLVLLVVEVVDPTDADVDVDATLL
jgi:hypothetical protein